MTILMPRTGYAMRSLVLATGGELVTAQCETHWEYDAASDVLDVYFGEKRRE